MLGHILGGLTRAVDPVKLEAVDKMIVPTSAIRWLCDCWVFVIICVIISHTMRL